MTIHGILIAEQIYARTVESLTRSAVSAVDVDNGNLVILTTYGVAANEGEVWTAIAPSTGDGITDVWMAMQPENVESGTRLYRGLDPDPRNFTNAAGVVFTIFKPKLHDIIKLSTDAISGTIGANTFINCTNAGGLQPAWATTIGTSQFAAKLLGTTWISVGSGAMDSGRVVAYQFEVVAL